jgi:hypothetical protein
LSRLTAHHQEVLLCIYSNWYMSCIYVDWLLAGLGRNTFVYAFNSPTLRTRCGTSPMHMSAKSPCVKERWPRCLNLNTASALQSQRTCEAVTNARLHLPHPGLSTSPNLHRYPFKGQCPVSSFVITLSHFLLKLSNPPAFLAEF